MKSLVCLAALALMTWAASSALGQQNPAPGKFDGRYTGTVRCVPSANVRYDGSTIRGDVITYRANFMQGPMKSCSAKINPDGSFSNSACDLPIAGKIVGDKLEFHVKGDRMCDISATREKG